MSSPALASTSMCLPAPHVSIIMLDVIWNRERLTGSWTRNTQECICEDFLTVLETYERYRVTMLRYSIHADIPIVIAHNRSKILRVLLSYYRDFFFVSLSFYTILLLCNFFFSLLFFFCLISHVLISVRSRYRIRNTIIYNYDFILLTLYDSLVFELIIFFWQLKVIRSLNLIRWYDIFQFFSFDHSQFWLVYLIIFTKEEENNIEILKNFSMQNSL